MQDVARNVVEKVCLFRGWKGSYGTADENLIVRFAADPITDISIVPFPTGTLSKPLRLT